MLAQQVRAACVCGSPSADDESEVKDYSEKFVLAPVAPERAGAWAMKEAVAAERAHCDYQRPGRAVADRGLISNGTISDLATRRRCLHHRRAVPTVHQRSDDRMQSCCGVSLFDTWFLMVGMVRIRHPGDDEDSGQGSCHRGAGRRLGRRAQLVERLSVRGAASCRRATRTLPTSHPNYRRRPA